MKKSLIISSLFAFSFTVFAAPRGEEAAREIAFNHFFQKSTGSVMRKVRSKDEITLAGTASGILGSSAEAKSRTARWTTEPFFIYNNGNSGFVIVSGDDAVEPILAYSDEGAFVTENIPEQVRGWLQMYADEMAHLTYTSTATFDNSERKQRKASSYPESVAPLLKYNGEPIQWDQNTPFNNDCPSRLGYLCPTGCVATAFAQIMYYHRWPEHGQGGTKTYISYPNDFSLSFNYSGANFDYNKMLPHYYYGNYTEEQAAEAAKLSYAVGVAVDMQYDIAGSGAYSVFCGDPIIKYFNYDKNLHYAFRDYFTRDEWIDMIKKELSEGRPICYAGSSTSVGHQFIFDGYDRNDRVHVNWGWAGMSDGYFALSVLAPSSTGTGGGSVTSGGFIYHQAMWMGMQRPTETSTPVSFMTINSFSANMDSYTPYNLEINKTNAMVGETIVLSTTEIANLSVAFKGVIGAVIEDMNGNQIVLNQSTEKSFACGAFITDKAITSQECVIPADLADGNYTLYFASKANGELRWSRMRAAEGYCDHYEMNVVDGMVTFSYNGNVETDGTLVADHNIYTKCRSQFTAKIKNENKREYFGVAHVGIYKEDENGNPTLIAICGKEQVSLPYDEDVEIVFRGAIEAVSKDVAVNQGDYKACVILENQGKYYQASESIDITIKRIPSGMAALTCDDFTMTKSSYGIDEPIEGHFNITNTRSVYSDFIGIIIFKENSNSGSPYWEKEVFLENGVSAEFNYSIPPQFEPGKYKASLRYTGGVEYSNEIKNITFEVRDEYVSMKSVSTDNDVRAEGYYNFSGQRLKNIPSKGAYIIKQQTLDGVRVIKKFSK